MADKKTGEKPTVSANPVPEFGKSTPAAAPVTTGVATPAPGQPVSGHPLAGPGKDVVQTAGKIANDTDSAPDGGVKTTDQVESERDRDAANSLNEHDDGDKLSEKGRAELEKANQIRASRFGRVPAVDGFDFFAEAREFMAAGRDLNAPRMAVHGGRMLTMSGEAFGGSDGDAVVVSKSLRAATDEEAKRKAAEMDTLANEYAAFKEETSGRVHHFSRPDYYRHGAASGAQVGMAAPRPESIGFEPSTVVTLVELVGKLIERFRKK